MVFFLGFLLFLLITSLIFLIFSLVTIFTGAPYVGTSKERIKELIVLAKIKKGEKALDLGSGDGRIVIAMAKTGAIAYGYEFNPFLVLLSRWNIFREGLHGKAFVRWKNFWQADLSSFDVITIYGVSYIMKKLENKIKREAKKGARIISSSYSFKNWEPVAKRDYIFVYKKKD